LTGSRTHDLAIVSPIP